MSLPPLTIRRLAPELQADFLQYFEGTAFADNPKWKSCSCQFLYVDHAKVTWSARTAEAHPSHDAATDAENHYGPLSLYLSAGFTVHRESDDGMVAVRRSLL